MSDAKTTAFEAKMKELSTIRDILMGEEMAEYAENFGKIDIRFAENNAQVSAKFEAMQAASDAQAAQINARIDALHSEMKARFDKLESLLESNVDNLNKKIAKARSSDKAELGKMLGTIAQKLVATGE